MCKFISSDSVIGNFVIESLEKNDFTIELKKLYDFDTLLSEKLITQDYYTKFDSGRIIDFKENYPFLVESLENDCLHIVKDIENREVFNSMLVRYFRLGMPKFVITQMKVVSQTILE